MVRLFYLDNDVVVCTKPVGVLSESGGMPELLNSQIGWGETRCVHRLDMAVGGVMVYARSKEAAAKLSSSLAGHELGKRYLAVVQGRPERDEDTLKDLLYHDSTTNKTYVVKRQRRGVKEAELRYRRLQTQSATEGEISLLRVELVTGRSHQIRVQFASRKLPLVGDSRYGSSYRSSGIALWCEQLSFPHPKSGEMMTFTCPPPEEWPWKLFSVQ